MDEMMKLVIGWTIVLAFVFTTVMTCMSMFGWVTFASKKLRNGLYTALILEIVVGTAGKAMDSASFDPRLTGDILRSEGAEEVVASAVKDAIDAPGGAAEALDKETLEKLVGRLRVVPGSDVAERREELARTVKGLPAGKIKPEDLQKLRGTRTLSVPQRLDGRRVIE